MGLPPGLGKINGVALHVARDPADAGAMAAGVAAAAIRAAIDARGSARVIFASAPSQAEMLAVLLNDGSVDWSSVHALHMDEYVGLPDEHPRAFGEWLRVRLSVARLGSFERLRPGRDPDAEARRYAALLARAPIDVTCMGIGMNGHIAFNEPGDTDFGDPRAVRVVALDETSRKQQVQEGLFATVADVPTHAVTLTVPALLRANTVVVTVHGRHKAAAVAAALSGPVDPMCPASVIRTHPGVSVHLDLDAASALDAAA